MIALSLAGVVLVVVVSVIAMTTVGIAALVALLSARGAGGRCCGRIGRRRHRSRGDVRTVVPLSLAGIIIIVMVGVVTMPVVSIGAVVRGEEPTAIVFLVADAAVIATAIHNSNRFKGVRPAKGRRCASSRAQEEQPANRENCRPRHGRG